MAIPAALLLPNAIRTIAQTSQAITTAVKSYGAPAALATGTTGLALKHLNQNNVPSASSKTPANRALEIIAPPTNPVIDLPQPGHSAKLNVQAHPQKLLADPVSHFWGKKSEGPNQNQGNSPGGSPSGGGGGPDWVKVGISVGIGSLGADYLSRIFSGDGIHTNVANLFSSQNSVASTPNHVVRELNNNVPLTIDSGELGVVSKNSLLSANVTVSNNGELLVQEKAFVNGQIFMDASRLGEKGRAVIHGTIRGEWVPQGLYGGGRLDQEAITNSHGDVEIGPTATVIGKVQNRSGTNLFVNGLVRGPVYNAGTVVVGSTGKIVGDFENFHSGKIIFEPGAQHNYKTFTTQTVFQKEEDRSYLGWP
ncbi:MAG TPA: polymer-forming cytoskeletal protein [Burkholderiaceae bacterium]|nr:polymer-forming cytoskeletal protein [Burkholderiaceae bacterium]